MGELQGGWRAQAQRPVPLSRDAPVEALGVSQSHEGAAWTRRVHMAFVEADVQLRENRAHDPFRHFIRTPTGLYIPRDKMAQTAMKDFARYLLAKRSVDDRALNRRVWGRLERELRKSGAESLRIVDVGAGLGTGAERIAEWRLLEALF